jgi:hypothetical protein
LTFFSLFEVDGLIFSEDPNTTSCWNKKRAPLAPFGKTFL